MENKFDLIRRGRENFIRLIDDLDLETLNKVPTGFNNNLAWHLGHIIASQQIICYSFSGQQPKIKEEYINKYRKGTRPEADIDEAELNELKDLLFSTLSATESDFAAGVFTNYKPVTLSFGNTLNSIADALAFVPVHDSLHLGYAMALRRAVLADVQNTAG